MELEQYIDEIRSELHAHAKVRPVERGTTEAEVIAAVQEGEQFPAKYGRTGFRRNFSFGGIWWKKHFLVKQVEAYAVKEGDDWIGVTLIARYF